MKKFLALIMAMAAFTASAATDYGIEVNGTKVTSDKISFSTGGGTVTYNASACRLILNDVIFSRSGEAIKVKTSSNRSSVLKIVFNGTCLLTSTGSDAVVLEEGAEFYVNSVTTITTNGGGKYAVHVKNDEDASFYGSGSLLLEATDGFALGGVSGGDEWAYFKINGCTLAGKRCNIIDLGRVQINALNTNVERSTIISFNPTSTFCQVENVGEWVLQDNVHVESPIGYSINSISQWGHHHETFVISDERDNPNYTQIGNFQYTTGTYNGNPVAKLMKPTVAYKQSKPTSIEIPGSVSLGGSSRYVYVNDWALKDLKSASRFRFRFGVMYLGSHFADGCTVLGYVDLPSSLEEVAGNAFYGSGIAGNNYMDIYWSTINPSRTALTINSFYNFNTTGGARFYFPTQNAIDKANAYYYLSRYNIIDATPLLSAHDGYYGDNFFVATTGVFDSEGELALVGTVSDQTSVVLDLPGVYLKLCGKNYSVTSVAPGAYSGKTNITTVNLSGSVIKEIGEYAFENCSNLTTVTLPSSITTVKMAAFYGSGLTTVTIPAAVKRLDAHAFSTPTLTSVTWNATNADDISRPFELCSNLQTFTVGTNVTRMPDDLLTDLTSLRTVYWNARSIADFLGFNSAPFYGLTGISSFKFGNSVEHIPDFLCYGLSNLSAVTLPQSLKTIGRCAFAESGLTTVNIPAGVTSLGDRAFSNCENLSTVYYQATLCNDMYPIDLDEVPFKGSLLSSIYFGDGVKRIPALLCCNQWDLTNISFPESLTEIGDLAIINCTGLTSITLPKGLTKIGQGSFSGCYKVKNIYPKMMAPASLSYGNEYIFASVDKETCTVTVPRGTLAQYKATMPWKEFFHIVQEGGFEPGDVNGDGVVSGADVTALYNVLLDGATPAGDADVNGDGVVSGADVTALYNILLN